MADTYLHIGLHKTATKYFQHVIFPSLDPNRFLYNPEPLTQYLMDYLKADAEDRPGVLEEVRKERGRLERPNRGRRILISREIMAGDLFTAYADWDTQIEILHRCFPDAKVLVGLRYQPDWLLSCYRESLHEHHYQDIEEFLNYDRREDRFLRPHSRANSNGYAHLYALSLDYVRMIGVLSEYFGTEDVFAFFYEHLRSEKEALVERMLQFIGSGPVAFQEPRTIPNRGYSALAIKMSNARAAVCQACGLDWLIHRPIFFFGAGSVPAGNVQRSLLDSDKYWAGLKKDNEEVRSAHYPDLTMGERLRRECSWRFFVKKRFDSTLYIDWDLLAPFRERLNRCYREMNSGLLDVFHVDRIPQKYLL